MTYRKLHGNCEAETWIQIISLGISQLPYPWLCPFSSCRSLPHLLNVFQSLQQLKQEPCREHLPYVTVFRLCGKSPYAQTHRSTERQWQGAGRTKQRITCCCGNWGDWDPMTATGCLRQDSARINIAQPLSFSARKGSRMRPLVLSVFMCMLCVCDLCGQLCIEVYMWYIWVLCGNTFSASLQGGHGGKEL